MRVKTRSLAACLGRNFRRLECTHLSTEKIKNSLLALLLADSALQPDLKPVCMALSAGPLVFDFSGSDRFIYFPVDALMTLGPANSSNAVLAVVGWHGCVASGQTESSAIQSHVMVPGQAYRLDWSVVAQDPARYTAWLWHTTAATHGQMEQMAQTAFCVQHHHATQRLASWLLMCLAQYGGDDLVLPLACLPASILASAADLQNTLQTLESQGALAWRDAHIEQLHAGRLVALACRCHTMVRHTVDVPPLQRL